MKPTDRQLHTFAGLRRIVATLRGPDGCPWDKVQTHESLRPYLVEELGDLLLEVLLHIQIAEENGDFTLGDVVYSIGDKLVRRHPHVFADAVAETPDAVVEQWDKLKSEERGEQSALTGIPAGLPGLAQAQAIQRRASRAGFRFETVEQVWEALEEELDELRRAKTPKERTEEMGDSLFALANLARWYEADAEDALRSTSRGFSGVFTRMEGLVRERGIDLGAATVDEKMALWDEAKADART